MSLVVGQEGCLGSRGDNEDRKKTHTHTQGENRRSLLLVYYMYMDRLDDQVGRQPNSKMKIKPRFCSMGSRQTTVEI